MSVTAPNEIIGVAPHRGLQQSFGCLMAPIGNTTHCSFKYNFRYWNLPQLFL